MWTLSLTVTGLVGMYLIPRHWWAWLIYLVNELLWLAYALEIHSHPLMVMSLCWGAVGVRNLKVARDLGRAHHLQGVWPQDHAME